MTYPDSRVVHYDYDLSNGSNNFHNRHDYLRNIRETDSTGTILAQYSYTSGGIPAVTKLDDISLRRNYFNFSSEEYDGFDRFGRIKEQRWEGYNMVSDADQFDYVHDYNSNVTSRDIPSAIYAGDDKDQTFVYDDLDRMTAFDEGTLSSGSISGTPTREQDLTLDSVGNWVNQILKTAGSTDLNQTRTLNDANEISNITESTGPAWVTPAYDAAGNMTTIPKPGDPTGGYTATYDAFNRLVKLEDGANTVAEYEYDGVGQRIVKSVYASGTLDHRQHTYYNGAWQPLEVRKEVSSVEDSDPLEQFVYHPDYIDAPLLRDYDANTDGTADRHYYTFDANYNVTAVTDDSATVLERYEYSPFGELSVLDDDFSADADGVSDIENSVTYTGRQFDAESGLYYFRHRYHHPQMGHFTTRDPAGYVDGVSLYQGYFAPGGVDPSGLLGSPFSINPEEKSGFEVEVPGVGMYELTVPQKKRWDFLESSKKQWMDYTIYVGLGLTSGTNPIQSMEDELLFSALSDVYYKRFLSGCYGNELDPLRLARDYYGLAMQVRQTEHGGMVMSAYGAAISGGTLGTLAGSARMLVKPGAILRGGIRKIAREATKKAAKGFAGRLRKEALEFDFSTQVFDVHQPSSKLWMVYGDGPGDEFGDHFCDSKWLKSDGSPNWPNNDGFLGEPQKMTLEPGTLIDRYGKDTGTYMSPYGTPLPERSLAPGTQFYSPYTAFEVLEPLEVDGGVISPWFGQPGMGIQYHMSNNVQFMLINGQIRVINIP
ncbi:MAG: glycohydrolase toxin TNT-related protein [Planctomycetaceae bacterium]|nr:glycohydrolase toxin TNT-related protein [Planctomycetaceae bacterium]